jgi:hypothetical protein
MRMSRAVARRNESPPVMPAKAGIQYAAALAVRTLTLWNTGSPLSRG